MEYEAPRLEDVIETYRRRGFAAPRRGGSLRAERAGDRGEPRIERIALLGAAVGGCRITGTPSTWAFIVPIVGRRTTNCGDRSWARCRGARSPETSTLKSPGSRWDCRQVRPRTERSGVSHNGLHGVIVSGSRLGEHVVSRIGRPPTRRSGVPRRREGALVAPKRRPVHPARRRGSRVGAVGDLHAPDRAAGDPQD